MQQPKASGPTAPALFTALLTLVTGLPHFQLIYLISTITAGSGWQLLTALVPTQGEQVAVKPSTHAQIFVRGWQVKGCVSADVLERDERRGARRVKAVTTQCWGVGWLRTGSTHHGLDGEPGMSAGALCAQQPCRKAGAAQRREPSNGREKLTPKREEEN